MKARRRNALSGIVSTCKLYALARILRKAGFVAKIQH